MDKFLAMRTFVRIVDAGSLTAAADALDTSLPTVVRTLAALERQLGVTLLNRTTRRNHLTDDGAKYLEQCRVILTAMQEAEKSLGARRSKPAGKLVVTASMLFGRRHVAPVVSNFLRTYPQVTAELMLSNRVVDLIEEGVDVGIRIAHLKDSSLIVTRVGRVRRVVCASEKYLRRHGDPKVPNNVRDHRCIRHTGLMPHGDWQFRVGKRFVTIPIPSVLTSNDIDSAINACIDGLGLGMFLSYMVGPNIKSGQLKYVLEKFETEPVPIHVVYPRTKLLSSKVRLFVDECVEALRHQKFS